MNLTRMNTSGVTRPSVKFPSALRSGALFRAGGANRSKGSNPVGDPTQGLTGGEDSGSMQGAAILSGAGMPGASSGDESWQKTATDFGFTGVGGDSEQDVQQEIGSLQQASLTGTYGGDQILAASFRSIGDAGHGPNDPTAQDIADARAELRLAQHKRDLDATGGRPHWRDFVAGDDVVIARLTQGLQDLQARRETSKLSLAEMLLQAIRAHGGVGPASTPTPDGGNSPARLPQGRRAQRAFFQQLAALLNQLGDRGNPFRQFRANASGAPTIERLIADPGSVTPREGGHSTVDTSRLPYVRQMGDPPPDYFTHGVAPRAR